MSDAAFDSLAVRVATLENALKEITEADHRKTVYQHAGDWLRMVNMITWTLASIYLVGAVIALNGALQSHDSRWRLTVGLSVFLLSLIWGGVDYIYEYSAKCARVKLENIEAGWGKDSQFYTDQLTGWGARRRIAVWILIGLPILGVGLLGLGTAFDWVTAGG
jgi:hypothetical protein